MSGDQIQISQLKVDGKFGVSERERRHEQTLLIDLTMMFDTSRAAASDDLADTVSYTEVARAIMDMAAAREYKLIEKFASDCAALVLKTYPVSSIRVKVRKPNPSGRAYMNYAAVEIERSR